MATNRVPGTKLVRASALPASFRVPSLYHAAGPARAVRVGRKVLVTFLGHTVRLPLSARVRVFVASLPAPVPEPVREAA
jgi:hypothetical protein